jgi:hypothetical protein
MRGFECKNLTPIKAKEITEIANVTRITAGIIASAKPTTAAAFTIVFAAVEFRARNRSMERNSDTKVTARRDLGMKIPHGIEEQT